MELFVTLNPAKGYAGRQLEECYQVMEIYKENLTVAVSEHACMTKPMDHFVWASPELFKGRDGVVRHTFPLEYLGNYVNLPEYI